MSCTSLPHRVCRPVLRRIGSDSIPGSDWAPCRSFTTRCDLYWLLLVTLPHTCVQNPQQHAELNHPLVPQPLSLFFLHRQPWFTLFSHQMMPPLESECTSALCCPTWEETKKVKARKQRGVQDATEIRYRENKWDIAESESTRLEVWRKFKMWIIE